MPDGLNTYKSTLTPQEVDEAFRNIGKVQANIEKAAGYAQTAEQYGTIVQQNQAAIQAIEDNLADVQGAAQNAADAKNAATSAAASASAASQSASDAEDAAKRAEAAAGIDPNDYYPKTEADQRFQMPIGYVFDWASVPGQSVDLSTPEKVAQYFGYGTWAAFGDGQFLLGAGGSYQAGNTGGEAEHTLTKSELPNESLQIKLAISGNSGAEYAAVQGYSYVGANPSTLVFGNTDPLGSGAPINNMPPYIVVYRWQRIA